MDKTLPEVEKDWNALLQTLEGHSDPVNAVAFSPDGQGAGVGIARQHGQAVGRQVGRGAVDARGPFRPCQRRHLLAGWQALASVSWDKTVRLWDAGSGAALHTLETNAIIRRPSFSEDGTCLETGKGQLELPLTYSLPVLGWIIYNPFSSPCPG